MEAQDTSAPSTGAPNESDPEAKYASTLAPLREKHGRIVYWELEDFGLVVAAKPKNPQEYIRLVNELARGANQREEGETFDTAGPLRVFAATCVVHPDGPTTKKIFHDQPAFALKVAAAGQKLCGGGVKALGKD